MSFPHLEALGLTLTQLEKFTRYRRLLTAWNTKVNLTAITADDAVEIKHFFDSLLLARYAGWQASAGNDSAIRVADVGAGAGFPGIPLKIIYETIRLDLFDASNKRVMFLQALAAELGLADVNAFHARAEDAGRDPRFRERYDWVVSRGVAPAPVLLEYCLPLVKVGGYLAAYKGPAGSEEGEASQKAATVLGGRLADIVEASLPEGMGERQILIYRKVAPTPKAYPRRPGLPAGQPIR